MSFPIMPFMKKVNVPEVPIMSFQTDKNGTFNPSMTIAEGTLRWIIDGDEQITNSPSKVLTGSTVDVEVFANTVPLAASVTLLNFLSENIIGTLDYSYFTINGNFSVQLNPNLSELIFSPSGNTSTQFRCNDCDITGSLDLSSFAFTAADFNSGANANLTGITFSASGNTTASFVSSNCNLTGALDLSAWVINGAYNTTNNLNLTGITFSASGNTSTSFQSRGCNLTGTLDLSAWVINGAFSMQNNLNLTDITFSASGNTSSSFRIFSCNLTGTLDVSGWTMSGLFQVQGNSNLTAVTQPAVTTGLSDYRVEGCALPIAQVDGVFSFLNTFFSSNTPIKDLPVNTSGGTNASPTGGSSNINLVNLRDVVYPGAGFTFTASIN